MDPDGEVAGQEVGLVVLDAGPRRRGSRSPGRLAGLGVKKCQEANRQDEQTPRSHGEVEATYATALFPHLSRKCNINFTQNKISLQTTERKGHLLRGKLQGCAVSRYRLSQARIGTNFWQCILLGEPDIGYRLCKRYVLLILKLFFVDLVDTEPVSGSASGLPIQISCI